MTAPSLFAQSGPRVSLLRGFEPVADYVFEVDGELSPTTKIYLSERIPAFLVKAPEIPDAVLLMPRTQRVRTIDVRYLVQQTGGIVDLLADAVLEDRGALAFQHLEGTFAVSFTLAGRRLVMRDRPPLLGLDDGSGLKAYDAAYVRLADQYTPEAKVMADLRQQSAEVRVRVYFGTWCGFCKTYVPRMLKVAEQLAGSRVVVDFYGLPQNLLSDPISVEMKVKATPTGIVYKNGEEVGRILGDQWQNPELSLSRALR